MFLLAFGRVRGGSPGLSGARFNGLTVEMWSVEVEI